LYPLDYGTSINFPVLTELYVNFGLAGIIIGMFLIGIIYRIIYKMLNRFHRKRLKIYRKDRLAQIPAIKSIKKNDRTSRIEL